MGASLEVTLANDSQHVFRAKMNEYPQLRTFYTDHGPAFQLTFPLLVTPGEDAPIHSQDPKYPSADQGGKVDGVVGREQVCDVIVRG